MSPEEEEQTPHALDHHADLPARNRASLVLVIVVQAMNSFSDNFSKMLLIVFAHAVAKGTHLGDEIQANVGLVFSLPYIFFAPMAGYLSDRHSKQRIFVWAQVVQTAAFLLIIGTLLIHSSQASIALGLACMFLLATEAAVFAPAKMGILKDLAGSRRLGLVSGLQQFTMFAAVMGSYAVATLWFGGKLEAGGDPWKLALTAMGVMTALSVVQTLLSLRIHRTEDHPDVHWRTSRWWEHFENLRTVFRIRAVGLAALGVMFFWFLSNAIGAILISLCNEHFSVEADAIRMKGQISIALGVGVVSGILLGSVLCRRRINLFIVPAAGLALAAGLFWGWQSPIPGWMIFASMGVSGLAAGAFMVPLYGFIQDRSRENERAQVLAGVGLIDCMGSFVANLVVLGLLRVHVSSAFQLALLGVASAVVAASLLRLPRMAP